MERNNRVPAVGYELTGSLNWPGVSGRAAVRPGDDPFEVGVPAQVLAAKAERKLARRPRFDQACAEVAAAPRESGGATPGGIGSTCADFSP